MTVLYITNKYLLNLYLIIEGSMTVLYITNKYLFTTRSIVKKWTA